MSIEQVEQDIKAIYEWFAGKAPGVTPLETGTLADLWALADEAYSQEPLVD